MPAERYYLLRGLAAHFHARLPQPQASASTRRPGAIGLAGARGRGFTFIELMVVIAILALLAALLVPSLARAGANATGIQCMNNLRQLTLGWFMYSGNSGNKLVSSQTWDAVSMVTYPQWTNWEQIQNTDKIYPYVKDVSCWHCPADVSAVNEKTGAIYAWGGVGDLRARSVSMNFWLAGPSFFFNGVGVIYTNLSSISNPANTIVFVDENPGTINDAMWWVAMPDALYCDIPASYHNNGGGISYADGHLEIHVWHDPAILGHVVNTDSGAASNIQPLDAGQDLDWLDHHVTHIPASFGSGF